MLNWTMNEIRLLIIEEHQAVRRALQTRLQSSSNLEVVAVYPSAAEWQAQRQLSNKAPCADVALLGLKGSRQRPVHDIIQDIKAFQNEGAAVIVLASVADDIERELALQAGAQRYLLKDINSIHLIAEIEALAAAPPS